MCVFTPLHIKNATKWTHLSVLMLLMRKGNHTLRISQYYKDTRKTKYLIQCTFTSKITYHK